ncbi:guanine nucleotide-binding protein G(I)/G(S)/G(O) subunit gamma-10 isoform X1 [Kogia breviceps]|uniref:guanine nucleotide-binding protein G(I)/G(S)/G(O) subunit gamma-10 isoform X1 n=1 Tax=Kogia breviceps TaxID=27615 RepID=UPI0034D19D23
MGVLSTPRDVFSFTDLPTGLSGGGRASTVLHAECLQGRPAGRCSSRKQPLSGAQILCFILKTVGKKSAEECFQAPSDE